MGTTNFPNGVTSYGIPVLGAGIPAMYGDVYFVDYANGSDGNSGKSMNQAYKTYSKGNGATVTDQNDLILINGDDPVEEDSMTTVSKNKAHVIGLGVFGATDQEPRIIFTTTGIAATVAAVIKVSGWGNTFTNVRVNNWSTASGSAIAALHDAGEGTVYTNCQFNMFGLLGNTDVSDFEARGDSSTFRNCKFGTDTLLKTAARHVLLIKGTGGSARMKNNYFENCYFLTHTNTNSVRCVKVFNTNSLAFMNVWKECVFMSPTITSTGGVQLLSAVDSVSGLVEGSLLFVNPTTNAASFCDNAGAADNDRIIVAGPGTATAATTAAGVGVAPT